MKRGNRELDLIIDSTDWGAGPHLGWYDDGYNVEMYWDYQGAFPNLPHGKHLLMNDRAYRRPVGPGIHPASYSYAMLNPCTTGIDAPR